MLYAVPPELHVVGTQIETLSGCPVRLVGVNVDSLEWSATGTGPTPGGIVATVQEAITNWNVNCVRIALDQDWWDGNPQNGPSGTPRGSTNQANYKALVDAIVALCNANNIYCDLDLHWSGDGPAGSAYQQYSMPDQNSLVFWQDLATRYANNTAVLFDTFNEPFTTSWTLWKSGGTTTDTPSFSTPGLQGIVNTIRATGARNICLVGGQGYSYTFTGMSPITDPGVSGGTAGDGIVYTAHIYNNKGTNTPAGWQSNIDPALAYGPVLVEEYGNSANTTDGGAFVNTLLPWFDGTNDKSYVYSALAWDLNTQAGPVLISDWNWTLTTYEGTQVKAWLAGLTKSSCPSGSPTFTPVTSPSFTRSPTRTPTPSVTASSSATRTPSPSATRTPTSSPTTVPYSATPSSTSTPSPSRTSSPAPASPSPTPLPAGSAAFAKGADIGWLSQMESQGIPFYTESGAQEDCRLILQQHCLDTIRLRVWVNPAGGWCGKADVISAAVKAAAMGFRILIDFHYSDTWADPGHQAVPAAWAADTLPQLEADMAAHTVDVLSGLKAAGVTPEWVQVGNETNDGFMWPLGQASVNMANFAALVDTGYGAVKSVFPNAKVIVHISNGYDDTLFRWIFDGLKANGARWDVCGMSLYPDASTTTAAAWTTYDPEALATMNDMVARYNKDTMVCEVGMDVAQPTQSFNFLTDILAKTQSVSGGRGLGVVFWEPEAYNGWQGYTKVAFDNSGKPTLALSAFGTACATPPPGSPTPSATSSRTGTPSPTRSATPNPSPSGTVTSTPTRTSVPVSPSVAPSGSASPTPIGSPSTASATVSATATPAVPSATASATAMNPSATATPAVPSATASSTAMNPSATATPAVPSATASATAMNPSATVTPSASITATASAVPPSPTARASSTVPAPTQTPKASATASPAPPTASASPTAQAQVISVSATSGTLSTNGGEVILVRITVYNAGSEILVNGQALVTTFVNPTELSAVTPPNLPVGPLLVTVQGASGQGTLLVSAKDTFTPTPAPANGAPTILGAQPWPNPNPAWLSVDLKGPADSLTVVLWTLSLRRLGQFQAGPLEPGWNRVALPPDLFQGLANGTYYLTLKAAGPGGKSGPLKPLRFVVLR